MQERFLSIQLRQADREWQQLLGGALLDLLDLLGAHLQWLPLGAEGEEEAGAGEGSRRGRQLAPGSS